MALPAEPAWDTGLSDDASMDSWLALRFTPAPVPGCVWCLKCASLVADGEQARHWGSLHMRVV